MLHEVTTQKSTYCIIYFIELQSEHILTYKVGDISVT